MKIKIKCITPTTSKLALVKMIKEHSLLGLRDSKDIADELLPGVTKEVDIINEKEFVKKINQIDGKYYVGLDQIRDVKLLKLGIGNTEEYTKFIAEHILDNNDTKILNIILNKLSKKELVDIINKINLYDSNL